MASNDAPLAGDPPQPLKRKALFELRRQEMRRRGESSDDISEETPKSSRVSYTLSQLDAMEEEFYQECPQYRPGPDENLNRNWITPTPSERARMPGYVPDDNQNEESNLKDKQSRQDSFRLHAVPHLGNPRGSKRRAARFAVRVKHGFDEVRMRLRNMREAAAGRQWPRQMGRRSRRSSAASRSRSEIRPAGEQLPNDPFDPADSADLHDDSEIDLNYERQQLANDMLAAARPNSRDFFHTPGLNAFPGDDPAQEIEPGLDSALPAGLFPHRRVEGVIELGSYLASTSYIISLGGLPLPDLRYGVIIVPAGDESLLFRGYGDHAAMSPELVEEIYAKNKAAEKLERVELWKKVQQEWWDEFRNSGGSEPGQDLDEDDVEFLRQRRLARKARLAKKDDGSEDASGGMVEAANRREDGDEVVVGKGKAPEKTLALGNQHESQKFPAQDPISAAAVVSEEVGLGGAEHTTEDHDAASSTERVATGSSSSQTAGQQEDPDRNTLTDEADEPESTSLLRTAQPASATPSNQSDNATDISPQPSSGTAVPAMTAMPSTPPVTQLQPPPPSPSVSRQTLRPSTSASASASNNATITAAGDTAEEEEYPQPARALSAEACRALETLLRGTPPPLTAMEEQNTKETKTRKLTKSKFKKDGRGRGFKALLRRKGHGDTAAVSVSPPSPHLDGDAAPQCDSSTNSIGDVAVESRAVLLEVAAAVERMARDEMRENPGVDVGVWRAARKAFASPA